MLNDSLQYKAGDAYRRAGVDMDAFNTLVKVIQPMAAMTRRSGSDGRLGGFGGVFDMREAGFDDPLLIAANDGVGTKLDVAIALNRHDTIGIDLVAMSVNDVIAQGGRPLLFLDYFATSRLDIKVAEEVIIGIVNGCKQAGCTLVGGETAEMPDMYKDGEYDLAGFALGACERGDLLPSQNIQIGDILFGLASNGFHANGFSLLRHTLKEKSIGYDALFPFNSNRSVGEFLLQPTCIYVASLTKAMEKAYVKSLAHITGGGLLDNIPRALPDALSVEIDLNSWKIPTEMQWFQDLGGWDDMEMARTFNCGIGMAGVVAKENKKGLFETLQKGGETVYEIGRVVESKEGKERVHLLGELETLK